MPVIAVEGIDGSGKSTQVQYLQALLQRYMDVRSFHFPDLDEPCFGETIRSYLFGDNDNEAFNDPYFVASLYAGNRKMYMEQFRKLLEPWNKTLLVDRYVASNVAYQGARITDKAEREEFISWVLDLELGALSIRPMSLTLYLDIPAEVAAVRLNRRSDLSSISPGARPVAQPVVFRPTSGSFGKVDYDAKVVQDDGLDLLERDLLYQQRVREIYLSLAERFDNYHVVSCLGDDGEPLSEEALHQRIRDLLFGLKDFSRIAKEVAAAHADYTQE